MRTEFKYRLGFIPGRENLLHLMTPDRLIGDSVGEFTRPVTNPETKKQFFATNDQDGYSHAWFEILFRFDPQEFARASILQIMSRRNFIELTYDEKTSYDESQLCPFECGFGRVLLGPMVIPQLAKRRVPPFFLIAGGLDWNRRSLQRLSFNGLKLLHIAKGVGHLGSWQVFAGR